MSESLTRVFATDGLRLQLGPVAGRGLQIEALDLLPEGAPFLAPGRKAELAEVVVGNPPAAGSWRNAVVLGLGSLSTPAPPDCPGVPASALVVAHLWQSPDEDVLTVELAARDSPLRLRCAFERAPHGALRWRLQGRLAGAESPLDCTLRLPLLRSLHPGSPAPVVTHLPSGPQATGGRPLVRAGQFPLPFAVWSSDERQLGLAVLARWAASTQVVSSWAAVPVDGLTVRLRDEWLNMVELLLAPVRGGWPGAFTAFRQQIRATLDLSEYARPDLAWYRDQWIQHFTFAYGREVFDFERERFDVDRLLDEGEREFGGYDGIVFWPQYPRLGLDQRSQWDFWDDLPGGRPGVAALARRARERGTRFFVPYLPWDDPPDERRTHRYPQADLAAQVVRDCEADSLYLDTMSSILPAFRRAIDAVRQGVVFCSEGRPQGEALELITGSWAQDRLGEALEVDLQRFLLPEHPTFVIFRHSIGEARRQVLLRALFNGTGLVVWQDIFGEVLAFTPEQRALVRRIAGVLRGHAGLFRGTDALPLVPTRREGLYANLFVGKDGRRALTLWNATGAPLQGELLALTGLSGGDGRPGTPSFDDVWNGDTIQTGPDGPGRLVLTGTVPPEISVLIEQKG